MDHSQGYKHLEVTFTWNPNTRSTRSTHKDNEATCCLPPQHSITDHLLQHAACARSTDVLFRFFAQPPLEGPYIQGVLGAEGVTRGWRAEGHSFALRVTVLQSLINRTRQGLHQVSSISSLHRLKIRSPSRLTVGEYNKSITTYNLSWI